MNKFKVKQLIIKNIQKFGWLNYPQLLRFLMSEGVEISGSFNLQLPDKNVVLWGGMSEIVVSAISELLHEGRLTYAPAPIELYLLERLDLNQPIILALPQDKLEHPTLYLTILCYVKEDVQIMPLAN